MSETFSFLKTTTNPQSHPQQKREPHARKRGQDSKRKTYQEGQDGNAGNTFKLREGRSVVEELQGVGMQVSEFEVGKKCQREQKI